MKKKTPSLEEMVRMRIVLRVPGMDEAQVRRDVVYRTVAGQDLHMDVYSPPGTEHDVVNTGRTPLRYVFIVARVP